MGLLDKVEGFAKKVKEKRDSFDRKKEEIEEKKRRYQKAFSTIGKASGIGGLTKAFKRRSSRSARRDPEYVDIGLDESPRERRGNRTTRQSAFIDEPLNFSLASIDMAKKKKRKKDPYMDDYGF